MEYLTVDWLRQWAESHCADNPTKEEREKIVEEARFEAEKALAKLQKMEITFEPIIFDKRDFPNDLSFALAMDMVGNRFKDVEEIVVRYAKPESKDKKTIYFQFHIVKEKVKK